MSIHIQQDNKSQKFEMYFGLDLPWTLYDGTLHYGFFATRELAEAGLEDLRIEAREEVRSLKQELEEAEDLLDELEAYNG